MPTITNPLFRWCLNKGRGNFSHIEVENGCHFADGIFNLIFLHIIKYASISLKELAPWAMNETTRTTVIHVARFICWLKYLDYDFSSPKCFCIAIQLMMIDKSALFRLVVLTIQPEIQSWNCRSEFGVNFEPFSLFCIILMVNTMVADDPVAQWAKSSAVMVLTLYFQNVQVTSGRLTHCGLVAPYSIRDFGLPWICGNGLSPDSHIAITWANNGLLDT